MRMVSKLRWTCTRAFVAALWFASPASAESISLSIAMEEADNRPFEYVDAQGRLTGFHVELVRAVAAELGWEVQFQRYAWKRAQALLEAGQVDAVTYIGKTPERERYAWFLPENMLHVMRVGLYVRKERAAEIRYRPPLSDMMKRWRFGAALGYEYNDEINELFKSGIPVSRVATTQGQLFSALLRNRFDVAIALLGAMDQARRDIPDIDAQVHRLEGVRLSGNPAYIVFSRNRLRGEEMARRFAREYSRWRMTPAYGELTTRFGVGESLPDGFLPH
ncbi:MAG TPA: transporter substrate-binding domain-containing protein [Paucimonas sp.]|nr:transporter substrate-binding domain-containing protein [Paucimonas sp.]